METLSDLLAGLSKWCEAQPGGSTTWLLMQTIDEGRRGFQISVIDHSQEGETRFIWHCNEPDLVEIVRSSRSWLSGGGVEVCLRCGSRVIVGGGSMYFQVQRCGFCR